MTHREAGTELDEWLRRELRAGYDDTEVIAVRARDVFYDTPVDEARLQRAFTDWRKEQQGWPERTDCDRLDEAFGSLEAAGIVALQNFACCSNCALAEVDDELEKAESRGVSVDGFAFFHQQD